MEKLTKKIALYPGCSLEGTASCYEVSLCKSLAKLDISLDDLDQWSCCGATSAHAMDHTLYLSLALRNLMLAEQQGYNEILAPCAACYHRLASASFECSQDPDLLKRINDEAGLEYQGTVKVRNVLDYLSNVLGARRIASAVKVPLSGMKAVCYYGCLNTRIPRMRGFDDRAYPMSMDRVVQALGVEALDWSYKTDCCGGSLFVSSEDTANRLVSKILKDAEARGADCIVVACPMCHNNLDTKQADIRSEYGIASPIPVLFVSQLMGLAYGISESQLQMADSFVPFDSLELSNA